MTRARVFVVPGTAAPAAKDSSVRQVGALACVGIGVAAAVVALLPWLATGARLPLQNLWAEPTLPGDMPRALLPFGQYAIALILSLIVVGYGAVGIAVRALRPRLPDRAVLAAGSGAVAVHVVAAAQSATTVASGLQDRTASTFYLAAVLAVVAGAVLTGLLVLRLLAAPPRAGAVIGLSLVALLSGSWLAELMMGLGSGSDGLALSWLNVVVRWVPAVLVGAAIAWGGLGTRGRVLAAAVSLLLLWIVPAAITAVTSAAGSRVLLPYPSEMLGYALDVLRAAMSTPGLVLPPVLAAAVVAAAGIVLRGLLEQRLVGDAA